MMTDGPMPNKDYPMFDHLQSSSFPSDSSGKFGSTGDSTSSPVPSSVAQQTQQQQQPTPFNALASTFAAAAPQQHPTLPPGYAYFYGGVGGMGAQLVRLRINNVTQHKTSFFTETYRPQRHMDKAYQRPQATRRLTLASLLQLWRDLPTLLSSRNRRTDLGT